MKKTLDSASFIELFNYPRDSDYYNYFSQDCLEALYDYFAQLEEDNNQEIAVDAIEIISRWSFYETCTEAYRAIYTAQAFAELEASSMIYEEVLNAEELEEKAGDELCHRYNVIAIDSDKGGILISHH